MSDSSGNPKLLVKLCLLGSGVCLVASLAFLSLGPKTSDVETGPVPEVAALSSLRPADTVSQTRADAPTVPAPAAASAPAAPAAAPPESAAELERRYFAKETTAEEREGIIADLGTLEAGDALGRIYHDERRWETRMKVLEVAGDLDSDRQHEQKLALLKAALAPSQNRLLREVALDQLGGFDDPRAAALVDATTHDADRELRAAAQAIREARATAPPP